MWSHLQALPPSARRVTGLTTVWPFTCNAQTCDPPLFKGRCSVSHLQHTAASAALMGPPQPELNKCSEMEGGPQAKQIPCPQERHSRGLVLSSPAPAAVYTQQAEPVTEGTREEAGVQSGSFLSLLSQEPRGGAHRHIKRLSKGRQGGVQCRRVAEQLLWGWSMC